MCVCVYSKPLTNWNAHPSLEFPKNLTSKIGKWLNFLHTIYLKILYVYTIYPIYIYIPHWNFHLDGKKCQCFAQFSSSPTPLRLLEFSATSSNFSELPITLGFPAGHMSLQRSSDTDWGRTSTNTWSAATYGGFYGYIPVIPINNLKFTSKYGSPRAEPFAAQGRGGPSSSW